MVTHKILPFLTLLLFCFAYPLTATETADFVIVGAGTSGCALAARICTNLPHAKVSLLERSPPRTPPLEFLVRAARLFLNTWVDPGVSEIFPSLPDEGINNRTSFIVTGATLGGSSSVNGMQWTFPLGDTLSRWNIKGLTPRVAQFFYRKAYASVGFARQPGPLRQRYTKDYINASVLAGFRNRFLPFSSRLRTHVWQVVHAATPTGRRIDSCTAYLKPVQNTACADNLVLKEDVTVSRILLSDDDFPRATGVEYVRTNDRSLDNKMVINANKEVIVAAGPFGSPKLLQLSGIGPAEHIRNAGVRPKIDLPVGSKTQARQFASLVGRYSGMPLEPSNNSTLVNSPEERRRFEAGQSSVLGTSGFATHATLTTDAYTTMGTGLSPENQDKPEIQSACISNPTAFGYLRIVDPNPFTPPAVKLNILGNDEDLRRLQRCMEKMQAVHNQVASSFNLSTISPPNGPTEEFLRNNAVHAFHYVGGCPVGSVLEGNLKVRGTRGLRVVDASVFNSIPTSAGPLSSTYMLAEYASKKISEAYMCDFGNRDDDIFNDLRRTCPTSRCENGW